jgi:hypothetical protein
MGNTKRCVSFLWEITSDSNPQAGVESGDSTRETFSVRIFLALHDKLMEVEL